MVGKGMEQFKAMDGETYEIPSDFLLVVPKETLCAVLSLHEKVDRTAEAMERAEGSRRPWRFGR